MGLKKRLAVAFCISILVPILLLCVASVLISGARSNVLERGSLDVGQDKVIYYVVRENHGDRAQIRMPVAEAITIAGIIILATAVIMVFWLYRSLIRPLNVLHMATENIKEGNLDFTISGDPEDELGQLCEEFEEMRIRLKELIDARLKYEADTVELISNISHDLKTPLTAIKGYAEGMIDGVADTDDKKEKYLRTIYTKASDMSVLVDELSLYSKLDNNIVPYNFGKIDVNAYFEDCVDEQEFDLEVKGISLNYESGVEPNTSVCADPEQIRRVVGNIIGNAVKYMDKEEGHVSIRTMSEGDFVRVEIEDNGSGISKDDLEHVFERFFRSDSSRGTKRGGTGLGLAIVKKLIEDHGGSVGVTSELGVGSCFWFTLRKYHCECAKCEEVEDAEYSVVSKHR